MGFWWCCCEEPICWTFSDSFDRADSTNLGASWQELSGDWGINNLTLIEKWNTSVGTSGAKVICLERVPLTGGGFSPRMQVDIDIYDIQIGDVYTIYLAYDLVTGDSLIASFTRTSSTFFTLSVTQNPPGPDGSADSTSFVWGGSWATIHFQACWDGIAFVARMTPPGCYVEALPSGTFGTYAGLGHSNAGHANLFDNFVISMTHPDEPAGQNNCPKCGCLCVMPRNLIATYTGFDNCSGLTGFTLEIDADECGRHDWTGSAVAGCPGHTLELTCIGDDYYLSISGGDACLIPRDGSGPLASIQPISANCNPLTLVFEIAHQYCVCSDCLPCGWPPPNHDPPGNCDVHYLITITENVQ